nr:MAG TPA: hypothetical protein [Caudoviricetes sp.]
MYHKTIDPLIRRSGIVLRYRMSRNEYKNSRIIRMLQTEFLQLVN